MRVEFDPRDSSHREGSHAEREHLQKDPAFLPLREDAADDERNPIRREQRKRGNRGNKSHQSS